MSPTGQEEEEEEEEALRSVLVEVELVELAEVGGLLRLARRPSVSVIYLYEDDICACNQ